MGTNAVTRGMVGQAVATNVQIIRKRRLMSQQQLADALGRVGRPLQSTAIAKIEAGDRRVDVDDLAALAIALNVSPARLLLPDQSYDETMQVAPGVEVPAWSAWDWATGRGPLYDEADDRRDEQVRRRELDWATEQPLWRRVTDGHPLYAAARRLLWSVERALPYLPGDARDPERSAVGAPVHLRAVQGCLQDVRAALKGAETEMEATDGDD